MKKGYTNLKELTNELQYKTEIFSKICMSIWNRKKIYRKYIRESVREEILNAASKAASSQSIC